MNHRIGWRKHAWGPKALLAGWAVGAMLAFSLASVAQDPQPSSYEGTQAAPAQGSPAQGSPAQDSPTQDGQAQDGQALAAQTPQQQAANPPSRVARVSVLMGDVSVEPASVDQFGAAELNYPLTTGDRLYAGTGANAAIETGQLAVRLGQQTDLTVTAMTDTLAQFGLAQGSVHLRSFALDPGETVELDTPNVAVTVLQPGDVRVDVDPGSDTTTVSLLSGEVQVDGNGLEQQLQPGQRVRLAGSEPVSAQWLEAAAPDGLDSFSTDRDGLYESAIATESQDVSPDTIGAADLESNGDWETDPTYGAVWYPNGVAADWVPYSCGRFAWVAPWGWTWVGCESWGFAPFHYGRWRRFGVHWGWIPGPPTLRPIYAPALVVFAGGSGFAVGGVSLTAWFPLGPGEAYVPWYHASPLYVNRLNVADIFTRNLTEARRIYNERTAAFAAGPDHTAGTFVNRSLAMTAVPQTSFAAGRPVGAAALHLTPEQRVEAQIIPHPLVTPERSMVVGPPARALPPREARPALASREGSAAQPAIRGVERNSNPANPPAETDLFQQNPAPTNQTAGDQTAPIERQPGFAAQGQNAAEPNAVAPSAVRAGREAQPAAPAAPRPLYNRAVPPPPRPSFEQQRQAIQSVDPGRPLGPQQMQNLRENRPAGPPQQPEIPHPAPQIRAPEFRPPPAPRPPPPAPKR